MKNDRLTPWARWMLDHKLRWALLVLAVLAFPFYLFYYMPDAIEDFQRDIEDIK